MRNILYLTDALTAGGSQTVLYNIAVNLDRSRFRPFVISLFKDGVVGPELRELDIAADCLEVSRPFSPRSLLRFVREISRRVEKHEISIAHSLLTASGIYGGLVAGRMKINSVLNIHAPLCKGRRRGVEALSRRLNQLLIAGNRITESELSRTFDKERIRLIYNGIDPEPEADLRSFGEKPIRITTVANFFPQKDHMTLLRAFELVSERYESRLTIVASGENELKKRVVDFLNERNMTNVELTESRDPHLYSKQTDIFALSSFSEGLPVSVTEAMSAGLPVVASDVGAMREIVDCGRDGLLVPAQSVSHLAEALLSIIEKRELREEISRNARKKVESKFALTKMATEYESLYDSLS